MSHVPRVADARAAMVVVVDTTAGALLHICAVADWQRARHLDEFRPDSLHEVGFVHLSTPDQVHLPANRLYAGRTDLVLLHLEPARLSAPVRWEPGEAADPMSMLFPHLYGAVPVAAVVAVTEYRPGPDGRFPPVQSPDAPAT